MKSIPLTSDLEINSFIKDTKLYTIRSGLHHLSKTNIIILLILRLITFVNNILYRIKHHTRLRLFLTLYCRF